MPTFNGRAVMGLYGAVQIDADSIHFGTGASTWNEKKEAEHTVEVLKSFIPDVVTLIAEHNLSSLSLSTLTWRCERILEKNSYLHFDAMNTRDEVQSFMDHCVRKQIYDAVLIVSSPWHIQRAHTYALDYAHELRTQGIRVPDIQAVASHGLTESIAISEPPHRGDRPDYPIHKLIRRADRLGRIPDLYESFAQELEDLVGKYERLCD